MRVGSIHGGVSKMCTWIVPSVYLNSGEGWERCRTQYRPLNGARLRVPTEGQKMGTLVLPTSHLPTLAFRGPTLASTGARSLIILRMSPAVSESIQPACRRAILGTWRCETISPTWATSTAIQYGLVAYPAQTACSEPPGRWRTGRRQDQPDRQFLPCSPGSKD